MKWKRTLGELLLLGVLILAFNIQQAGSLYPPATEWTRTYGTVDNSDEARSLIQTDDCGYAIFGFTRHYLSGWVYTEDFLLVKTDSAGNVEWNRTYGAPTCTHLESGQSAVQTDDGGYALAGYLSHEGNPPTDYDLWLVKTDSLGNMQWNHTYGGAEHDLAHSVVQTGDGEYVIAGFTDSYGAGSRDFWLIKTDSAGNMMWNQTYGGTERDHAFSMVRTSEGGYAIGGKTRSFGAGNYDFWLIKTDSGGNVVWNQTYGGYESDVGYSLVQTSDRGYALAGLTKFSLFGDDDLWLVKTDMYGNVEWNKTYGLGYEENPSLVQTSDGGYALASITTPFGGGASDWWLVKTDLNGDMEWNQIYGGKSVDRVYSLIETSDEGFALAGFFGYTITAQSWLVKTDANGDMEWNQTYSVGDFQALVETSDGGFALAAGEGLAKTDENGNMEWNQTYGGDEYDCFHALIETSDGGYALAGETYSFSAGASDFWLVKTDAQGIPEFPSWIILPLILTVTTVVAIYKKRLTKKLSV